MPRRSIAATISTRFEAASVLRRLRGRVSVLEAPFSGPRARAAIEGMRNVIRKEFARGGYFNSSGNFIRWKPGHDFGDKKAQNPVLGGPSGKLGRAWLGGPGGFQGATLGGKGVEIGVGGPVSKFAAVHRGGNPVRVNRVTIVRPKKRSSSGTGTAMRYHLGLRLHAWISERRLAQGLRIPARPHVLRSPQIAAAVKKPLLEALRGAR